MFTNLYEYLSLQLGVFFSGIIFLLSHHSHVRFEKKKWMIFTRRKYIKNMNNISPTLISRIVLIVQ